MLTAYLRGLLKPNNEFGLRSLLFEDVILEAMAAHISVENFRMNVIADSAIANVLTDDSKRSTLRRVQRQAQRHAELQLMDIYSLTHGGGRNHEPGTISLLQLFQLMKKEGIIQPEEAPPTEPE